MEDYNSSGSFAVEVYEGDDAKSATWNIGGGKASIPSSGFNLANSAIGAGVLAFPFAFYQTGLLLGLLITIVQVILSSITLEWIGNASLRSDPVNADSYEKIVKDKLGSLPSVIVTLLLVANVFGAMVSFIIIIGDMTVPIITELFGDNFFTGRGFVTLIFVILVIIPISCLQNIDNLKFTSILSLLCISSVVVMVCLTTAAAMVQGNLPEPSEIKLFRFSWDVFQAIPIITFALTCHPQAPPIYHELANHTRNRFRVVIGITYGICFFLYVLNGAMGYIHFQNQTKDNILNNFAPDDPLANLARLAVTFTVTFSYPLMNYAFRTAFDFIIFNISYKAIFGADLVERLPSALNITIPSSQRYIIETVVAGILCWILNVLVPQISVIFGLIGAIAGSSIVFIIPGLLHYKSERVELPGKIFGVAVTIFGIILGIVGTTTIVIDIFF